MEYNRTSMFIRIMDGFNALIADYLIGVGIYLNTCFSVAANKNLNSITPVLCMAIFFWVFHSTVAKYVPCSSVFGKHTKKIRVLARILFMMLCSLGFGFKIINL